MSSNSTFGWSGRLAASIEGKFEDRLGGAPPLPPLPPAPPVAELHINMKNNATVFRSWTPREGYQEVQIPTRVVVDRAYAAAHPGAGAPFSTDDIVGVSDRHAGDEHYGPAGAFIDVGDEHGRDIHGRGHELPDAFAAQQGWVPTNGGTRGQNVDLQRLGQAITRFQKAYPTTPIPYRRTAQ